MQVLEARFLNGDWSPFATSDEAKDSPTAKEDQISDDPSPTKTKKACQRQKNGKENVTTRTKPETVLPQRKTKTVMILLPQRKFAGDRRVERKILFHKHHIHVSDISTIYMYMTIKCVVCMLMMCCYM